MKTLTIVSDEDSRECLYIDGVAWKAKGETTVYAVDICQAAGDQPVRLVFESIDFYHHDWPDTLEAALVKPDYCV